MARMPGWQDGRMARMPGWPGWQDGQDARMAAEFVNELVNEPRKRCESAVTKFSSAEIKVAIIGSNFTRKKGFRRLRLG